MAGQSALTVTKFKARFPGIFADLTEPQIKQFIDIACQISNVSYDAIAYLTAHLIVCEIEEANGRIDGGSGEVNTETIGKKTVVYKEMAETNREVFFTRTHYGRMFLIIEGRSPKRNFGAFVAKG